MDIVSAQITGVICLFCALVGIFIGERKARPIAGFLYGLLLGPIGLVIIALATFEDKTADDTKKCPDCAEQIKSEAKKCRFCGSRLPEDAELHLTSKELPTAAKKNLEEGGRINAVHRNEIATAYDDSSDFESLVEHCKMLSQCSPNEINTELNQSELKAAIKKAERAVRAAEQCNDPKLYKRLEDYACLLRASGQTLIDVNKIEDKAKSLKNSV